MRRYAAILLATAALALLLLAPDEAQWSVILAYFVLMGYQLAWRRRWMPMAAVMALTLLVVFVQDTAVSVVACGTEASGFQWYGEVMPAAVASAFIVAGYWCSWTRRPLHVAVCLVLATATLLLGW